MLGLFGRVSHDETGENWVFFARQRGNEGGCSQQYHEYSVADPSRMTVALPTDGPSPSIRDGDARVNAFPGIAKWGAKIVGRDIVFTVNFPDVGNLDNPLAPMVWGEFRISYAQTSSLAPSAAAPRSGAPQKAQREPEGQQLSRFLMPQVVVPPPQRRRELPPRASAGALVRQRDQDEDELYLRPIIERLSPPQAEIFRQALGRQLRPQSETQISLAQRDDKIVELRAHHVSPSETREVIPVRRQPNTEIMSEHRRLWQALVRAVGGENAARGMLPQADPPRRIPSMTNATTPSIH